MTFQTISSSPLSVNDRSVLNGRSRLLARMTKCCYLILALGIGMFVEKSFVTGGTLSTDEVLEALFFAGLFGGTLIVTHAVLAMYERRGTAALRADLTLGMKTHKRGILVNVVESSESEPTYFHILDELTGESEAFALRSISDLSRINPSPLIGKKIELEYAPNSRVVLQLSELPTK
jgi:hypothetical protein